MADVLPDGIASSKGKFRIKKNGAGAFLDIRCELIEVRRNFTRTIERQPTYCGTIVSPGAATINYTLRGVYDMTADKFTDTIQEIEDSDTLSDYEWYPEGQTAGTPVFSGQLLVETHNIVAATPGMILADVTVATQDDLRDVAS